MNYRELQMTLYEFYGEGCSHCESVRPKVEKLEEEENFEVKKLEVWNDKENQEVYYEKNGDENCGGVPYFFNDESEEFICGEADFETLKAWAEGEEMD